MFVDCIFAKYVAILQQSIAAACYQAQQSRKANSALVVGAELAHRSAHVSSNPEKGALWLPL